MMEAKEGRGVETSDIKRVFLQTDYYKGNIHIKMEGSMFNLLEEIDPAYYNYFIYIYSHRKKCMYE